MNKYLIILILMEFVWLRALDAQSAFHTNEWKIRQCPEKLKFAEIMCRKKILECPKYLCSCYLLHVFDSLDIDIPFAKTLIDSVEMLHSDHNVVAKRYKIFTKAAYKALRLCHLRYRALIKPKIYQYRYCVYDVLSKVCRAEDHLW